MKKLYITLIALALFGAISFAVWDLRQPRTVVDVPDAPGISSFTVERPNLVVRGRDLTKVEIWMVPTGTGITEGDYQLLGIAALESTTEGLQVWKFQIPHSPELVTEIFAKGYMSDQKISKVSLSYTGATQIFNALWGEAEQPAVEGVSVTNPPRNAIVKSPLKITGRAKGAWFFEASFPVKLVDANGKVIAQGPAQAQGEWMTAGPVPFAAELRFTDPGTGTGTLILENDNPSGLPERSEKITIPVLFAPAEKMTVKLYYPNPTLTGADVCSQDSLAAVERQIVKTSTPLADTVRLLIAGGLTAEEKAQGFSTEFPNPDFKLTSASIANGTAKLAFTEVPGFTGGGSCRMAIMAGSIIKTAQQFPSVQNVTFSPESLFQP